MNCTDNPSKSMESTRIQIRMPDEWLRAVKHQAQHEGVSLSQWIRKACERRLPAAARKHLGEVKVGRPPSDN